MSDPKPYTAAEAARFKSIDAHGDARLRATVAALDAARAEAKSMREEANLNAGWYLQANADLAAARAEYAKRYDALPTDSVSDLMRMALEAEASEHARFKARGAELDAATRHVDALVGLFRSDAGEGSEMEAAIAVDDAQEWLAAQGQPAPAPDGELYLSGRGPGKGSAVAAAVERLVRAGHKVAYVSPPDVDETPWALLEAVVAQCGSWRWGSEAYWAAVTAALAALAARKGARQVSAGSTTSTT
jgi:hypothetical protein